ncbi:DUF4433 domain-containing protein [Nocardia sp. NPDC050175]|uniref:type II toxin-antitoxin system toxin DNA ADP-ribosyl transferase DarT n=1 Tax=Nocardia sp. NPDC050175 TaxID=3364317 RepID=UPI0037B56822
MLHFTHISHLPKICESGLLADSRAQQAGVIDHEVGNLGIKKNRRFRSVPVSRGGAVADYVPFYFAPRSPMMYAIHKGNVETYNGDHGDLIYLRTTVERLVTHNLQPVFTDRNAALEIARFSDDIAELDTMIDWPLMTARMWNNTADDQDRRERRMAECLVHGRVPWSAFTEVVVQSKDHATRIELPDSPDSRPSISVRPYWYF